MQKIVTALAAMLLVVATAAPVAAQQRSSEPGADQAKPAQEQAKPESEKKPADRAVEQIADWQIIFAELQKTQAGGDWLEKPESNGVCQSEQ